MVRKTLKRLALFFALPLTLGWAFLSCWQIVADLGREPRMIYQNGGRAFRPLFEPDPKRQIEWIEIDTRSPLLIADGVSGEWSTKYEHSAIVGFADGSAIRLDHLIVEGNDDGIQSVSVRKR